MQILHERALHRYKAVSTLHLLSAFGFHILMYVYKIDLFRGHLKVAQQICDEFGVLSSSVCGVDIELKTEASVRRARTLLAAKQFSQVLDLLAFDVYTRSIHFIFFVLSPRFCWFSWSWINRLRSIYDTLLLCAGCSCGQFSFLYMLQVQHASWECKCSFITRWNT